MLSQVKRFDQHESQVMDHKLPDKKKLSLQTLLAKIEDVLQHGSKDDPPAYTLILGAGASFGIVPTAKEMLGIPDPSTKKVHDKSIPLWLAAKKGTSPVPADADGRIACVADFWRRFSKANRGDGRCAKIHPTTTKRGTPKRPQACNQPVPFFEGRSRP